MARQYSRKSFLRQALNALLKRYLAERALGRTIQWDALPERMTDDIHRVIGTAPERKRSEIDRDFREIQDLADEGGANALISEGLDRHHNDGRGVDLAPTLAAVKTPLHFAFLVFLEHRDVFNVASDLLFPAEQERIVQLLVRRVEVGPDGLDLELRAEGLESLALDLRSQEHAEVLA